MCMGGGSSASSAAKAATVTSQTPELDAGAYDDEKASETNQKKRRGKRALRIKRSEAVNVPGNGSGLNIPNS